MVDKKIYTEQELEQELENIRENIEALKAYNILLKNVKNLRENKR